MRSFPYITKFICRTLLKGGFALGEMTGNFAAKSRRNYFAAKLYLIFKNLLVNKNKLITLKNVKSNWE